MNNFSSQFLTPNNQLLNILQSQAQGVNPNNVPIMTNPSFLQNTGGGVLPGGGGSDWWTKLMGGKLADGTSMNGMLPVVGGLAKTGWDIWSGMQQMDLAKEAFDFKKDAWSKQFDAQRKTTNMAIADRGDSRGQFLGDSSYSKNFQDKHSI